MEDIKEKFKNNLKNKKIVSSYSTGLNSLVESLSNEFENELENNKVLKFKNSLSESFKKIKTKESFELFDSLCSSKESSTCIIDNVEKENVVQELSEDIIENNQNEIIIEKYPNEFIIEQYKKLISKEEANKHEDISENYTNLLTDPDVLKSDLNIKAIQNKLKFLEEWVSKISLTGPGGGSGQVYNLDFPVRSVSGNTSIGRTDYYIGVNSQNKSYITLPSVGENVYDGRVIVIKDESGHAQLTPIKIIGTIDNDVNGAEIRVNNAALQMIYRKDSWRII